MPSIVDLPNTLYIRLTEPLSTADEHLFPSSINIVPRVSTILYDEMSWFSAHRTIEDALLGKNPVNEAHWKLTVQTSWSMPDEDDCTQSLMDLILSSQAEGGDPWLVCHPSPANSPVLTSYDYDDIDVFLQRLHIRADGNLEDGSVRVHPILVMRQVASGNEDVGSAYNNQRSRYRPPKYQSNFEEPCTAMWGTLNNPPGPAATLQDFENPVKMEFSISLYTSHTRPQ